MSDKEGDFIPEEEAFHEGEPSTELPTLDELRDMADGFGGAAALVAARHPQSAELEILLVPPGQPVKIGNRRRSIRIEFRVTTSRDTSLQPIDENLPDVPDEKKQEANRLIAAVWAHFHPVESGVSDPDSIRLEPGIERDVAIFLLSKYKLLTYIQIGRLCDIDNAQTCAQVIRRVPRNRDRYETAIAELSHELGYPDPLRPDARETPADAD